MLKIFKMKRILFLLFMAFLIQSCDDGKIKADTIDFSTVPAQKCADKDLIYKINDSQMLILSIPFSSLPTDQTPPGAPATYTINATNQVIFRRYSSTVTASSICPTIPSASPNVVEEWNAVSGTINIVSTAIISTNSTTNATTITGYNYYITFTNITFQKPTGTQVYDSFVFGNYINPIDSNNQLTFTFVTATTNCGNNIFNTAGNKAFVLNLGDFSNLIQNSVTTTPRTALISSTNKVTYSLYSGLVSNSYICTPATTDPSPTQVWLADDGVADTNGIIEVTTTTAAQSFQHTIHLKKVTFRKGNSSFYLGDDYIFGVIYTP